MVQESLCIGQKTWVEQLVLHKHIFEKSTHVGLWTDQQDICVMSLVLRPVHQSLRIQAGFFSETG